MKQRSGVAEVIVILVRVVAPSVFVVIWDFIVAKDARMCL